MLEYLYQLVYRHKQRIIRMISSLLHIYTQQAKYMYYKQKSQMVQLVTISVLVKNGLLEKFTQYQFYMYAL